MVTLTGVEISSDHHHARCSSPRWGGAESVARASSGLGHASGYLRSNLAKGLKLRVARKLHFVYDESSSAESG